MRLFLRDNILRTNKNKKIIPIAIYGAGEFGAQLESALRLSGSFFIYNFFDDNHELWGRSINNIPIKSTQNLEDISAKIEKVFLAIPSLNSSRRRKIVSNLESYGLKVFEIPSVEDISSGKAKIDSLKTIDIEDLLCRESKKPKPDLLKMSVSSKVICITGAGGSIGSELCRQILTLKPEKLILIELSEINLYKIQQEIELNNYNNTKIESFLGDATDLGYSFLKFSIIKN